MISLRKWLFRLPLALVCILSIIYIFDCLFKIQAKFLYWMKQICLVDLIFASIQAEKEHEYWILWWKPVQFFLNEIKLFMSEKNNLPPKRIRLDWNYASGKCELVTAFRPFFFFTSALEHLLSYNNCWKFRKKIGKIHYCSWQFLFLQIFSKKLQFATYKWDNAIGNAQLLINKFEISYEYPSYEYSSHTMLTYDGRLWS